MAVVAMLLEKRFNILGYPVSPIGGLYTDGKSNAVIASISSFAYFMLN